MLHRNSPSPPQKLAPGVQLPSMHSPPASGQFDPRATQV